MKKEPIILKWVEQGKTHIKEVERQELYDVMDSIRKAFGDDNQISTTLTEVIPKITSISINKDRNEQKDIPTIYYNINGQEKAIDIIRYHKVIWAILNRYCTEW